MKTKKLPNIFTRILGLMLWIPLLLGITVQAEEPVLPASASDNMVLRLDATTLGLNDGEAVTQWSDISGFGHDAVIALSNAPIYKTTWSLTGKPSVNFSGSGQYLEIPHTSDLDLTQLTMFVVFQNSSNVPDDFGVITSKESGSSPWTNRNWWLAVERQRGELWFRTSTDGQQPRNDLRHTTYNYKDNEPHLVSITVPGSDGTSRMVVDGMEKVNVLSTTPNVQSAPVRIGGAGSTTVNRFFDGDIGEIIIYNRALTSEERQAVEIFLGKKWIGLYADEYFVISATAGVGGIIVPDGDIELPAGGGTTFNITPNAPYYEIADVKVDGQSVGAVTSYTFADVQKNYTIDAYFTPVDPDIVITVTAGPNGSIEPSETIVKYPGEYQTFTFTPEGNYGVADVIIDGESKGPMSSYTFSSLLESHTIDVEFDLTGPMVHLDADAITGLEHGQPITNWVDKSGYGNNATQSNTNNKPLLITQDGLNGKQVVRFDGINDDLSVANNYSLDMDQITMFAVYRSTYRENYPNNSIGVLTAKSRGSTNRSWWMSLNNNFSSGGAEEGIDPGALWFRSSSDGGIANNLYHNGNYNNGNAYMVSVVVPLDANNETSKLYIDGDQKHETGSSAIDHAENQIMRIGAGTTNRGGIERWFGGDIAEIIIYNRALSDPERLAVEHMLQAKWFGPQIPDITEWPTASEITYGQALSASILNGGEANVLGEFSFKYPDAIPDAAGTYTAAVVFTPDDTDQWESVEETVEITVNKAEATIVVAGYEGVYDGQAYGATLLSADGVSEEDLTEFVTVGIETYTDFPGGEVNWSFEHNNYVSQDATVNITITKAEATMVVNGYEGVYDGQAYGATRVSADGVNDEDLTEFVTVGIETYTDFPGGEVDWSFEHNNYISQDGTVNITITKAEATMVVNGYEGVYDGQAYGATLVSSDGVNYEDLTEFVTVGIETYTDFPGGEVDWSFEHNNYVSQNGTVNITITKAEATIVVAGYEGVYDGQAYGATLVSADGVNEEDLTEFVTVGTETFTNVPGGSVAWSFEHNNYVSQDGTVNITITKAEATIVVAGYEGVYDGQAYGATLVSVDGVNDEDLTEFVTVGTETFTNVPGGSVAWSFEHNNYISQNGTVNIIISKADATIVVHGITVTYDGQEHGATGSAVGVEGEALAGLDLGLTYTNVPGGTANWIFTDVTGNYNDDSGSVEIIITEKLLVVTAEDKERQYSDPNPEWTVFYNGFVIGENENVLDGPLTFTGAGSDSDNNTAPGEYAITPGGLTSDNYSIQFVDGMLTVTEEDAQITYIGTRLMAVKAGGTANLDLRVVVDDDVDGYPGNIINGNVTFHISWEGGSETVSTAITTADLVNNQKAVVNVPFDVTPANGETSRTLNIQIVAGGYYIGEEQVLAVVYVPAGDHVTGGGFIVPDIDESAGEYPSAGGSHANFGFNFKYHPKTGALQGQANLVIRNEEGTFQFKSTEALAMGISNASEHPRAQFIVRGELRQGNNVLLSNLTMTATMEDQGNPGNNDDIGFTIWNGNQLIYSSNWNGSSTARKTLSGGNIVIHRGGTDVDIDDLKDEDISSILEIESATDLAQKVELSVFPNPFREKLFIRFIPAEDTRAVLELYDMKGALVQTLFDGEVLGHNRYEVEFIPHSQNTAVLFYRLRLGTEVINGKIIHQQ